MAVQSIISQSLQLWTEEVKRVTFFLTLTHFYKFMIYVQEYSPLKCKLATSD